MPERVTETVIVGAGPYGLSLAAHLRAAGVEFRIFGRPMETWATQMPEGMKLKSDGFASNLFAPGAGKGGGYSLAEFCRETGRAYHDTMVPIAVEDFVAYGEEFARRMVPELDGRRVTRVEDLAGRGGGGARFRVTVAEGAEVWLARHVVLAVGLTCFEHKPAVLAGLPAGRVTHSSEHRTFAAFAGKHVTVLGRGASALNAAVLLAEAGAGVAVISRSRKLHVHQPPTGAERPWVQKVLHPKTPLGPSMRSWLACRVPGFWARMPWALKQIVFYKHLGPAGGYALWGRVDSERIERLMGWEVASAAVCGDGRLRLELTGAHGRRELVTDHVVAGTGFRVDVERAWFLAPELRARVRRITTGPGAGAPRLDGVFQSSVPGLFFVGPVAAACFGPMLRFTAGAEYACRVLTRVLGRAAKGVARESAGVEVEAEFSGS